MTVATGTYVSTTTLKDRLGGTAAMGTADDALLATLCEQVNSYIESTVGRVLAPIGGTALTTLVFDIDRPTTHLYVPHGIRGTAATVEAADSTGASYATASAGDVYLRPIYPRAGFPYTEVWLSDQPTGAVTSFSPGFATARVTALIGFAEIPEDVEDVAITMAVRAWHARAAGQADIVGTDEMGRPIVSRYLSGRDRATLFRYSLPATAT